MENWEYEIDSYVKFLAHFNGAKGTTTYTAETGQTITFVGTAQLDTDVFALGGGSLLLDGNSDYVTVPNDANWDFGSGNFTLECFAYWSGVPTTSQTLLCKYTALVGNNNRGWWLGWDAGKFLEFYYSTDGTAGSWLACPISWTPAAQTLYHIAFVRSGNTGYFFLQGTLQGTVNLTGATIFAANSLLYLGRTCNSENWYFNGRIDEPRICKGVARWSSNFVPPAREYGSQDPYTTRANLRQPNGGRYSVSMG